MTRIPPNLRIRRMTVVATAACALCLAYSFTLPTVTFRRLGAEEETYSIWGGIQSLWVDGSWFLATVVFAFSMVLPITKIFLLFWVSWRSGRGKQERTEGRVALGLGHGDDEPFVDYWAERCVVRSLRIIGKWSMLDVFMVTVFVGAIRFGPVASASSRIGILVFALAVMLSLLASAFASRLVGEHEHEPARLEPCLGGWPGRLLIILGLAAFGAALAYPLVHLSRGFMLQCIVALPSTAQHLLTEGEPVLGLGLIVFVLGMTALRILASLLLRWSRRASGRMLRSVLLLDEWAMIDVFALALAIVYFKLDQLTEATIRPGFWFALAAGFLINADAALLRHEARERAGAPSA